MRRAGRRDLGGGFLVEIGVITAIAVVAGTVWFGFLREERRPNVVLISIDSLRFDRLGCYGYDKPTTPRIDGLAQRGVRFERAHSTTSWTLPAHMALLTGLPDDLHAVVDDRVPLDQYRQLLAESFRKGGYVTAGFYSGPYLDPFFGFDRGFDSYENCGVETVYAQDKVKLSDPEREALTRKMERESHQVATAPQLHRAMTRFLDLHDHEPFFVFLHHWDVHFDYVRPLPELKPFLPDGAVPFDMAEFMSNDEIRADMAPGKLAWLMAAYDAEVRWVDMHVGLLLDELEDRGLAEDTIVVVTSDHGEEFFEHGNKGHRWNLHEETLRIPLVFAGPGIEPGHVVPHQARIFDVMPTLLDLCGLPPVSEVYGVSLAPFLRGEYPPRLGELKLIGELTRQPRNATTGAPEEFYFRHDAIGHAGWKLLTGERRAFDPKRPAWNGAVQETLPRELYDLTADPRETRDLASADALHLQRMELLLDRVHGGMLVKQQTLPHQGGEAWRPIDDPDILARLNEFGYVEDAELRRLRPKK